MIAPSSPASTTTRPWLRCTCREVDHLADGAGDLLAEERADEVHHRGHDQRDARGQRPRRDRGGDGVGGVVEPVGVVEDEGDDDDRDDDRELHAQDSLTAICSTMLATFSNASMAASSESTTSLSFITSSASYLPLNSLARIRR